MHIDRFFSGHFVFYNIVRKQPAEFYTGLSGNDAESFYFSGVIMIAADNAGVCGGKRTENECYKNVLHGISAILRRLAALFLKTQCTG